MPHAYATAADLRAHRPERDLIQLTDPMLDAIDETRIESALEAASAEIDGYLGARYPVPMDPPPAVLAVIAMDIAFYRLTVAVSPEVPEAVRKQLEDWCGFLRRVAAGKVDLVRVAEGGETGLSGPEDVFVGGSSPVFGRSAMDGY